MVCLPWWIDGTDISATPWPYTDAVEEVEVLQRGASAEYGNVQGAVFNIVTRMGGNRFHGDGNFYFQRGSRCDRPDGDGLQADQQSGRPGILQTNPAGMYMRYNAVTFMARQLGVSKKLSW